MSSTHSVLRHTAARATADAAHRRRDLHRLLTHWWALGSRLITTQAHGGVDHEDELTDAVTALEDALSSRHPSMWRAVQAELRVAMLEAEHTGDRSTSAAACLVCRRLGDGLPETVRQLIGLGQAR